MIFAKILIYSIIEMLAVSLGIAVQGKFDNQFITFNRLAGCRIDADRFFYLRCLHRFVRKNYCRHK